MGTKSTNLFIENIKLRYYPLRNSLLVYKYVVNFTSVIRWVVLNSKYKSLTSTLGKRIIGDLKSKGIAFTSLDELFPNENLLERMQRWVSANENQLRSKSKKKFVLSYFNRDDNIVELDLSNPFFNFYLSNKILYLVSSYLGYIPQFNYLLVEKTIPIEKDSQSTHSQNWHRDPEEKKTLKIFIYVNDVTSENGPFIYVKKSQPSSKSLFSKLAPQKLPYGSYPEESLIASMVKEDDMVTAVGKAGTVIFCDTAGIHKGGLSFSGERIMATGFYPSKNWTEKSMLELPKSFDKSEIDSIALQVLRKS
jgi:hypothetical protein